MPAGMAMTADHAPEAQRWNEVPPRQFHMPSAVQAPVNPVAEVPGDDEFDAGAALGVDSAGSAEVLRDVAVPTAAAEVERRADAMFVAGLPFAPEGAVASEVPVRVTELEVAARAAALDEDARVAGLDEAAGADPAAPESGEEFEDDEPLPPRGKQLVPTGFA